MIELTHDLLLDKVKAMTLSPLFQILMVVVFLDVLTGYAKAIKNKKINSKTGTNGIIRHIVVIVLQVIIGVYARALGHDYISQGLAFFFISNYLLSLMENLEALNIPFPEQFKEYFRQMRERKISIPNAEVIVKANNTNTPQKKKTSSQNGLSEENKEVDN